MGLKREGSRAGSGDEEGREDGEGEEGGEGFQMEGEWCMV